MQSYWKSQKNFKRFTLSRRMPDGVSILSIAISVKIRYNLTVIWTSFNFVQWPVIITDDYLSVFFPVNSYQTRIYFIHVCSFSRPKAACIPTKQSKTKQNPSCLNGTRNTLEICILSSLLPPWRWRGPGILTSECSWARLGLRSWEQSLHLDVLLCSQRRKQAKSPTS